MLAHTLHHTSGTASLEQPVSGWCRRRDEVQSNTATERVLSTVRSFSNKHVINFSNSLPENHHFRIVHVSGKGIGHSSVQVARSLRLLSCDRDNRVIREWDDLVSHIRVNSSRNVYKLKVSFHLRRHSGRETG